MASPDSPVTCGTRGASANIARLTRHMRDVGSVGEGQWTRLVRGGPGPLSCVRAHATGHALALVPLGRRRTTAAVVRQRTPAIALLAETIGGGTTPASREGEIWSHFLPKRPRARWQARPFVKPCRPRAGLVR